MIVDLAAATAGVSRRTLYYWMAQGRLKYTMTSTKKRSRHVQIEDVLKIAKKEKEPSDGK